MSALDATWWPWVFGGLAGCSVLVWCALFLDTVRQVLRRLAQRSTRRYQRRSAMAPRELASNVVAEAVLLNQADGQWQFWQLVCGGGGLTLTLIAFWQISPFLAPLGLAGVFIPRLVASMRASRARWQYQTDIRALLISLDLLVGLGGTLEMALRQSVGQVPADHLVARRLRYHLEQYPGQPEAVIQALAADFRSTELTDLALRVEGARRGGMITYSEAVQVVARDLQERLQQQAEERIEGAPTRMIIPMLAGLFPPPLILLVYPLAMTIMAGLGIAP
ncbi:MAG: hypothetical protein KKA73_29295 [Chloroflexi bacterium]|nr:hypothetical protein [Chloroflexota bacterium]MBU1751792.1 hypothetical protein [Chloroflexota bacterium]